MFLLQSFQLAARKVGSYSCHLAIAQRPFGAGRLSKSDANVTANAVSHLQGGQLSEVVRARRKLAWLISAPRHSIPSNANSEWMGARSKETLS